MKDLPEQNDDLDPVAFKRTLATRLRDFTLSAASISPVHAPRLASAVENLIARHPFVSGPYVESLPDFEKGESIAELVASGGLCEAWKAMKEKAPALYERKLHLHQRAAIGRDENYLVATGTGSGKTEAFLRAEIEREISEAPSFQSAFGYDEKVPKNWLLSRKEMLENPPDILITNYAMLEHILLLPKNRALLRGADLQWIVLDELHTYTGAQAIEVAFLLRKLKAALGIKPKTLKCVGTSASLDPSRKDELARFDQAWRGFG